MTGPESRDRSNKLRDTYNVMGWAHEFCTQGGWVQQRYLVVVMGFLAVFNSYTMRMCLSMAITQMADSKERNHTLVGTEPEFIWTENVQGLVLGSFFWGYVLTHVPAGILSDRCGGKLPLLCGILTTSVFTLFSPLAVRLAGATGLILVRFFVGLGQGSTFPTVNTLLASWVPPRDRSKLGTAAFAGSGTFISWSQGRWDIVFYVFGAGGLSWCIAFYFLCYNSPASHPWISDKERNYIMGLNLSKAQRSYAIPWYEILTSLPVWGLVLAQIGHDWVLFTVWTELPKYMKSVLKYDIKRNGVVSSIPNLAMFAVAVPFGVFSDWLINKGKISVTFHRKFFTFFSSYIRDNRTLAVSMFSLGMAFMGPSYGSLTVNALDLSPNFAGLLMAIVNGAGAVSGIVSPVITGYLIPNNTLDEWRTVFYLAMAVGFLTSSYYVCIGSAEVQSWNSEDSRRSTYFPSTASNSSAPPPTDSFASLTVSVTPSVITIAPPTSPPPTTVSSTTAPRDPGSRTAAPRASTASSSRTPTVSPSSTSTRPD